MIDSRIPFDNQTEMLYNELKSEFNISFQIWNNNYAGVYTQSKNAVISFNPKKATSACLAHELLHIWLKRFNYISSNYLRMALESHPFLSRVFDVKLAEHIGNCMDHFKMYPKFLEMGYEPTDFIKDGGKKQSSLVSIWLIGLERKGKYNPVSVNLFIGHLISILADHCDNDYSKHLQSLKEKDEDLYSIVTSFWEEWIQFDIENIDPIYNSDIELIDRFIISMEEWCETKEIIE